MNLPAMRPHEILFLYSGVLHFSRLVYAQTLLFHVGVSLASLHDCFSNFHSVDMNLEGMFGTRARSLPSKYLCSVKNDYV